MRRSSEPFVVPITLVILMVLFAVQRMGTGWIGGIFGPFMLLWFLVLGVLGIRGILPAPEVLAAISPAYALGYVLSADPSTTLAVLAAVFLAVTGGEALYADMGHFGRFPIRPAWFLIVMPGLMLNYLRAGRIAADGSGPRRKIRSTTSLPIGRITRWSHSPPLATVIASQAVITGAFSLTQQAIQLGFLPRMRVVHTSQHERGQIYVPFVNWALAALTLGAVLGFGSSSKLAGAYGLAVSF